MPHNLETLHVASLVGNGIGSFWPIQLLVKSRQTIHHLKLGFERSFAFAFIDRESEIIEGVRGTDWMSAQLLDDIILSNDQLDSTRPTKRKKREVGYENTQDFSRTTSLHLQSLHLVGLNFDYLNFQSSLLSLISKIYSHSV